MFVNMSWAGLSGMSLFRVGGCSSEAGTVHVSAGREDLANLGMEGALELGLACGFSGGGVYKGNGSALRLRSEMSHLPKYSTVSFSLDDSSDCSFCFEDGAHAGSFRCTQALVSDGSRASISGQFDCPP